MSVTQWAGLACPPLARVLWHRIEHSPLALRIAKGMLWSLAGTVVSRALTMLASILVARMLGREGFGQLGIVQSTVGAFGVLAGFGLGTTATKYVAEYRLKDPLRAGRVIALSEAVALVTGAAIGVSLVIAAPWLARTLAAPLLARPLRTGALVLFFGVMSGTTTGALAGFEAFSSIATRNAWSGLAAFPLMVVGTRWAGLEGAVWALAASAGLNWVLSSLALRDEALKANVRVAPRECLSEFGVLWRFALPATLGSMLASPVTWVCNAIVVNQPSGYAEMGIYNAANQWRTAILLLPGTLSVVALPLLANLHGHSDRGRYRRVLLLNVLVTGAVALMAALAVAIASRHIMSSYGDGFAAGQAVLVVLAFSTVLTALNDVVGQAIASRGEMWIGLVFNGLWAVALVAFASLLVVSGQGALGLACAMFLAYLMHTAWQSLYLIRMTSRSRVPPGAGKREARRAERQ